MIRSEAIAPARAFAPSEGPVGAGPSIYREWRDVRPSISAALSRLSLQYDIAVCMEISARHHGDYAAWQQAVNDQARLREQIAWLQREKEKRDEAPTGLDV